MSKYRLIAHYPDSGRGTVERIISLCRNKTSPKIQPDKETPLWNPHSMVIYWWTSTEVNANRALRVTYNGWVTELPKTVRAGYLGYRCVRP